MTKEQREQVRELLHDVLSVYQARNESAIDVTNAELKHINNHLKQLNGTVARHEKELRDNLPHTIINCPQAETIESLKDGMISRKAIKTAIITGVSTGAAVITIIFFVYKLITNTP